jgi:hypothetical protein
VPSGALCRVAPVLTLNMEAILSAKRRFETELYGTKSQNACIIDTAVKASQRTVFFDHK